jgi:hypothetical protein
MITQCQALMFSSKAWAISGSNDRKEFPIPDWGRQTISFLLYQPTTTSNKADKTHSSAIFFRATIAMASDVLSRSERSKEENLTCS